MAFMGRGDFNDIDIGNSSDLGHRHYFYRRFYYIPLDNTYVIMQMIVTFIIVIVGIITFLATYKSDIADPIENTKRMFMNTYLMVIVGFLIVTAIINFLSKEESVLIKRLQIVFAVSIIIMLIFAGIKLNMDSTYTKNKFEQIYSEQYGEELTSNSNSIIKAKIDFGITGMTIKSEKEHYIDECMKLYNIFKTKTYGILALHLLLNCLLIYQIVRVSKIQGKKEKINKDDAILFDEEQNVKF